MLQFGYLVLRTKIFGIGLACPMRRSCVSGIHESYDASTTSSLTETFLQSIEAAKQAFDAFLQTSPDLLNHLSITEWYHIIFIVIVLYRLSIGLPRMLHWNVQLARHTVDLETYLTCLIEIIVLSRNNLSVTANQSFSLYSMLPDILTSVKTSYTIASTSTNTSSDPVCAHEDLRKVSSEVSAGMGKRGARCPGFRYITGQRPPETSSSSRLSFSTANVELELEAMEQEIFWNNVFIAGSPICGENPIVRLQNTN